MTVSYSKGKEVVSPSELLDGNMSEATILQSILPQILEAVGSGYNHVEGRLNDVQNKRLPSLEQRLDAVEGKRSNDATTQSETSKNTRASGAGQANSDETKIQALFQSVEQLQEDRNADCAKIRYLMNEFLQSRPNDGDPVPSLSDLLDGVKNLTASINKLQERRDADERKVQSLSGEVKKLQADKSKDSKLIETLSEGLKTLQENQADGGSARCLEDTNESVKKLQEDRTSDLGRIQTLSNNLNKLQSQQAEKANRTTMNVLSEIVGKLQSEDRARASTLDSLRKTNRDLERRMESMDKQLKYLEDQSRKAETKASGVVEVNTIVKALETRLEKLESQVSDASKASPPLYPLLKRVDKLESRDAHIATVHADSQAMHTRVEKLVESVSNVPKAISTTQDLLKRVSQIESQQSDAAKTDDDAKEALLVRVETLEKLYRTAVQLQDQPQVHVKRPAPKRTLDVTGSEQVEAKRPRTRASFPEQSSSTKRPSSSSSAETVAVALKRASGDVGSSGLEDSGDGTDEDVSLRRTRRTVKPTERGSHLRWMDVNAAKKA